MAERRRLAATIGVWCYVLHAVYSLLRAFVKLIVPSVANYIWLICEQKADLNDPWATLASLVRLPK